MRQFHHPSATQRVTSRRASTMAAIAAVASMSLAACSSDPSNDATGDAGSGGDVTSVSFLSWDNEEVMGPLIDDFEAAHPDVSIDFSYAPPVSEYISTLQTRLGAGTAPDVFLMAAENKSDLIAGEYVVDLTDEPFMSRLADFNKDTYGADGRHYAASTSSWGAGVLYNIDMFDEAGITDLPTSWDEFLEVSATLRDAGFAPYLENGGEFPFSISALLGNTFGDEDVDAQIFAGETTFSEAWTPALEEWVRLVDEGYLAKTMVGLNGDQVVSEFATGNVAMIMTGAWYLNTIRETNPDLNFTYMPVPGLEPGTTALAGAASPGFAINAESANIDAAKEFVDYLTSDEAVAKYNELTSAITTTAGVEPDVAAELEPIVGAVRAGDVYLAQIGWKRHEASLLTEAVAGMQELVQGSITPSEYTAGLDAKLAELDS